MTCWAFLVGGRGARLGALTADTPKPLLPVAGRPFLEYLLDRAVDRGADRIVLLAGYLADTVVAAYEGRHWRGVPVRCSIEPEPLGTAGALRHAAPLLGDDWLLMNGDTLFMVDPTALTFPDDETLVSMVLRRLDDCSRSGVVTLCGDRVVTFRGRGPGGPGLVNGGVYRMRRGILDHIARGRACALETEVFPALAAAGRVSGKIRGGYFIDIGVPADYARAQDEIPRLIVS